MTAAAETEVDRASALCLSCGLCCSGGLFDYVELDDEDRTRFGEAGLSSPDRLPLLRPHFISSACSVYAIRPWRCSDYRCRVLDAHVAGDIDAPGAHSLVEQAKAMRALVDDALPPGLTARQLAQDVRSQAPQSRDPPRLLALARFVAYRLFVERHFLGPKSRWMTKTKA